MPTIWKGSKHLSCTEGQRKRKRERKVNTAKATIKVVMTRVSQIGTDPRAKQLVKVVLTIVDTMMTTTGVRGVRRMTTGTMPMKRRSITTTI